MTGTKKKQQNGHPGAEVPQFDRLQYFYGQMLGVRDFRTEQEFFREKIKLHNRCLHGHGIVCGLVVEEGEVIRAKPESGENEGKCYPTVEINPGLALDSEGNELVVRDKLCITSGII
jgi:hypothetical protein